MTVILYDYIELDERSSSTFKTWKAWHILLYIMAAFFGIANYYFFYTTMQLFDGNCMIYPRDLVFRVMELPREPEVTIPMIETSDSAISTNEKQNLNKEIDNGTSTSVESSTKVVDKRYIVSQKEEENDIKIENITVISGNDSHRIVLDTTRSLFLKDDDCQFPLYIPLMSSIFAVIWITMFIMCPGGGRVRSGLHQPWQILAPALIFALVFLALAGYSFTRTNSGLQALCAGFHNVTNSTSCLQVDQYVERSWTSKTGVRLATSMTRGMCSGVLLSWTCIAVLLILRCFISPDFIVTHQKVVLKSDPYQKITPHLKKANGTTSSLNVDNGQPTSIKDDISVQSDPTLTSELVTASIEHRPERDLTQDSDQESPISKRVLAAQIAHSTPDDGHLIELASSPQYLEKDTKGKTVAFV